LHGDFEKGLYCDRCENKLPKRPEEGEICVNCKGEFTGKSFGCENEKCTSEGAEFFSIVNCITTNCRNCLKKYN